MKLSRIFTAGARFKTLQQMQEPLKSFDRKRLRAAASGTKDALRMQPTGVSLGEKSGCGKTTRGGIHQRVGKAIDDLLESDTVDSATYTLWLDEQKYKYETPLNPERAAFAADFVAPPD